PERPARRRGRRRRPGGAHGGRRWCHHLGGGDRGRIPLVRPPHHGTPVLLGTGLHRPGGRRWRERRPVDAHPGGGALHGMARPPPGAPSPRRPPPPPTPP